ncbi:MAG: SdpI family protein [Candidatus Nealsonbacteria bacterium]|nr:SdpI family protein [Candidatus Nealsonbacteria bacterium]
MIKAKTIIFSIISLSFIIGICFYPSMPEKMASHWNAQDQVDGYVSKFWGLFLMPFISIGLFLLLILVPKIDPLKANVEKFRKYFDRFIVLLMFFLFYIYLLTLFWNIGLRFNMGQFMIPALGILFYYCGILIENSKRNWFIGIKTPWTLSSEVVWDKTHKIGGKLFKIAGMISFLGICFPQYAIFLVIVPVILFSVYTIIYSYSEYQKNIGSLDKS